MQLILLVLIAEIARLADAAGASERWLVFNQNTTFYPYTVHLPDRTTRNLQNLTAPPPLLLSLSGSGARGPASQAISLSGYDGTSRRVREYYEGNVSLSHRQAAEEFLVVTPICPDLVPQPQATWNITLLPDIIRDVQMQFPVDTTRIYLTSYSMGCWATYDLLMKNPTLFAGVICSSGATGASQAELSKLLGIPLRVYYGEKDAESMVTQIKATQQRYDAALAAAKAGGNVTFNTSNILETILIPGATHLDMTDDPWDESTVTDGYAGALSWLLTQQRASNTTMLAADPIVTSISTGLAIPVVAAQTATPPKASITSGAAGLHLIPLRLFLAVVLSLLVTHLKAGI